MLIHAISKIMENYKERHHKRHQICLGLTDKLPKTPTLNYLLLNCYHSQRVLHAVTETLNSLTLSMVLGAGKSEYTNVLLF